MEDRDICTDRSSSVGSVSKCLQEPRLGQDKAKSLELRPELPHGHQGPKYLVFTCFLPECALGIWNQGWSWRRMQRLWHRVRDILYCAIITLPRACLSRGSSPVHATGVTLPSLHAQMVLGVCPSSSDNRPTVHISIDLFTAVSFIHFAVTYWSSTVCQPLCLYDEQEGRKFFLTYLHVGWRWGRSWNGQWDRRSIGGENKSPHSETGNWWMQGTVEDRTRQDFVESD